MGRKTLTVNPRSFLKRIGIQETARDYQNGQAIYSQGDAADAMFQIQQGNVKLVVASPQGKRALIAVLGPGDVFGEGCLNGKSFRLSTAMAIRFSMIARVTKGTVARLLHEDPAFAQSFVSYLLARMVKVEDDFVDRLFNFSEQRLARILSQLANSGKAGRSASPFPQINQEQLAQMVGTTRSRVSHFMNKFRRLGFIDYQGSGALTVHTALLDKVLGRKL